MIICIDAKKYHYLCSGFKFFKNMNRSNLSLLWLLPLCVVIACGGKDDDDSKEAPQQADSFATYYFNWRYVDAARFATQESRKALSFMASNVSDSDIVVLKEKAHAAKVDVGDLEQSSDSTISVTVEVANYLRIRKIGSPSEIKKRGNYELSLVRRDGKWLVDLPHPLTESPQ